MNKFFACTALAVGGLTAGFASSDAFAAQWTATSDGVWFNDSNWDTTAPNSTSEDANFNADITGNLTVTLDNAATVGDMLFDSGDSDSYVISGPNTLSMGGGVVNADTGTANEVAVDLDMGGTQLFVEPAAGATVIFSGNITGTGGIDTSNESGTVIFRGDNSGLSGGVDSTIFGGRLGIGSDTALGTGNTNIRNNTTLFADGGDRTLSNSLSWASNQSVEFDGTTGNDLTFTGNGSIENLFLQGGTGELNFTGNLALSTGIDANNTGGRVNFLGNNTGNPGQIREGAIVGIGNDNALGDNAANVRTVFDPVYFAMDVNGGDHTIVQNFKLAVSDFNVDGPGDLTLTGNIFEESGRTGGLKKDGAGTLTLEGSANTYTLATNVNEGTLLVNGSITASDVDVDSGATLGGDGTISQSVNLEGTLAPGNSIGELTVGNLDSNNGIFEFELASNGTSDTLVVGDLDLTGTDTLNLLGTTKATTYTLVNYTKLLGSFESVTFNGSALPSSFDLDLGSGNNDSITLTVIPEPVAATLVGFGSLILLSRRRRP